MTRHAGITSFSGGGQGDEGLGRVGARIGGDIRTGANRGEDTWPGPGWLTAAPIQAFGFGLMGRDGRSTGAVSWDRGVTMG